MVYLIKFYYHSFKAVSNTLQAFYMQCVLDFYCVPDSEQQIKL